MLRQYRGFIAAVLSALLLILAVSGCGLGASGKKNNSGQTIHFGYITSDQLHSPAVMVMKEKKLLEAAGFNVEWHEYIAGAYAIQDMASGVLTFANCGIAPIIINSSQGVELAILAGSNQEGSSLVVDDSIKSVKDLDGKTIATPGLGSIQDAMITRLAMENNITIKHTTMEVSDMADFLKKKEIDGFIAWAPHPANAAAQKLGHELLASKDMMPSHQCCVLVTGAGTLQNDEETVKKVLEVYLDAYKWFLENQEESIKMLVKATGINESVVRRSVTTVKYTSPPYCNVESVKNIARGLIDAGRIMLKQEELDQFAGNLYRPELMETISNTKRP